MMDRTVKRCPMIWIVAIGLTMLAPAQAKKGEKGAAAETKDKPGKEVARGAGAHKDKGDKPKPGKHGKKSEGPATADKAKGEGPTPGKDGERGKGLALGKGKERGEGLALGKGKERGEGLALGKDKREGSDVEGAEDAPEPAELTAAGEGKKGKPRGKIAREQSKHMWRMARIERLSRLGEETGKQALVQRMEALREKEQQRYEKVMERLKAEKGEEHHGHGPEGDKGHRGHGPEEDMGHRGHGAGGNKPDKGGEK